MKWWKSILTEIMVLIHVCWRYCLDFLVISESIFSLRSTWITSFTSLHFTEWNVGLKWEVRPNRNAYFQRPVDPKFPQKQDPQKLVVYIYFKRILSTWTETTKEIFIYYSHLVFIKIHFLKHFLKHLFTYNRMGFTIEQAYRHNLPYNAYYLWSPAN